jgi:hypothetical protein
VVTTELKPLPAGAGTAPAETSDSEPDGDGEAGVDRRCRVTSITETHGHTGSVG